MPTENKPKRSEAHLTGATIAAPAKVGDLVIDARPLQSFLEDLPDGATQGMKREQDGYDEVHQEITGNQKEWGSRAGVTADEVAELVDLTAKIKQIRDHRPAVAKLLEMMDETEAKLEDRRHTVLRTVAQSVEAKATSSNGDALLAKYEKTFRYRSAVAHKAAKTRRSNANAAAGTPPNDGAKPG